MGVLSNRRRAKRITTVEGTRAGPPPAVIVTLELLGLVSALGGLMLIRHRFAFLRQEPRRQRRLAVAVWMIHVLALLAWFLTFLILEGGP